MKKLILLALLLLAGQCNAQKWVQVAETRTLLPLGRSVIEVNDSSIRVLDGYRRAWVRNSHTPAKQSSTGVEEGMGSSMTLNLIDCKNEEMALMQYVEYPEKAGGGDVGYSAIFTREMTLSKMITPIPGKVNDATMQHICSFL